MNRLMLLLSVTVTTGLLASCGNCNCNSYDKELLYGSPVNSRAFR